MQRHQFTMDAELAPPPLQYGKRLLPTLIDDIAREDPYRTFAMLSRSTSVESGYYDITFHRFSTAINRCAWWIETRIGRSVTFNTLAYLGPLDLLYHIAFLPSHRNSLEAHVSLLDAVNCQVLLVSENEPLVVTRILHQRPTKQFRIPSLEYFLQDVEVTTYDYDKTFEEARLSPFVVLQTSGSTGIPKPIVVNHGTLASMDAYHLISYLDGDAVIGPSLKGSKMLMAFPLYHMASFTLLLGYAAYYQVIGVLPPAVEPITEHLVDSILAQADVQGTALPPSLLVDLCHEESYLVKLARLHYVFYAGGSLPVGAGDKLSSITKLATLVGSTEVGYPPMKNIESTDWQYVCYSPFDGHVFRPLADDGLYEHFLVRRDYLNLFQGIFSTYPTQDEFPTQDVYRKHPTKPGLWRFAGRMDDVIVFSNAEKFYPGDFEDTISSHPAVRTTVMGGHGEFQPCLLIEPMQAVDGSDGNGALLDEIWPKIQEANKTIPTHARVVKDFILFTRPEKPVERAGKGTVQRTATLRLYLEEIASLYKAPEMPKLDPHQILQSELQQASTLHEVLYSLVSKSVEYDGRIVDDTDFFDLGLDSLQTLALSKKINAYLMQADSAAPTVTPNTIYAHSSIGRLASALEFTSDPLLQRSDRQRMQQIFDQCSSFLPQPRQTPTSTHKKRAVVLLTASTGSLGSYVLDALIQNRGIEKVYCLNRSKGTEARQTRSSETRGLSSDWQSVRFLPCDLGHQRFGLDNATYDELSKEVTHVVHNAWDVNFMRSLDSYVNLHINGVCRITEFCAYSAHSAHLVFISSESAVLGGTETVVKEEVVQDWSCAQGTGYAKAKLIAERLIDRASRNCHLKSSIVRIGQIAGPTSGRGVWNTQEWYPSMMASSVSMQKLPNELPVKDAVDWVPVDTVGKILVELLVESDNEPRSSNERQTTKSGDVFSPVRPNKMANAAPASSETPRPEAAPLHPTTAPDFTAETAEAGASSNCLPERVDAFEEYLRNQEVNQKPPLQTSTHKNEPNSTKPTAVFHIRNPHPRQWSSLIPIIQSACSSPLEVVPLPTWLVELEARIEAGGLKAEIPAQSLLEFVRGAQNESGGYLDITKASEKSRFTSGNRLSIFQVIGTLSQVANLIMSLTAKKERAVTGIQEIIGYTFNDPALVWEAVSAAGSFTSGGNRHFADGNKRLAVLGDTVLQLALAEHWYDGTGARAKKASGVFDDIRQQVGSNVNLSIVGRTANIDGFVNLSGAQRTIAPATMAVTVEAILGAVYLDSQGIAAVKAVMEKLGLTPA
ncbi:MAG: hypothetical protein L6R35_006007 [Caloplaca aegaea]|nr:MAG: hypothetical protein L6R35_006007 [Caloplaca aegaea]